MKVMVIGFGQCGSQIADEFVRFSRRKRHLRIITAGYAVDTDIASLTELSQIMMKREYRILMGAKRAKGHGLNKQNKIAAEIAREDSDKIINSIKDNPRLYEVDAFICICGTGGGTGSGIMPVIIQEIKQRFLGRPVYAITCLPFDRELKEEGTVFNTAVCIKSLSSAADAVILIDNQRYVPKDSAVAIDIKKINEAIAEPFYHLLCVGEEKNLKNIGSKVLDAGDIMKTISGWTAVGYGKTLTPRGEPIFDFLPSFRKKVVEARKGTLVMSEAITQLSVKCDPADAQKVLYLLSGPSSEMNITLVKDMERYLREMVPEATMRNGDYPVGGNFLEVTLVVSGLKDVAKVREYYTKITKYSEESSTTITKSEANPGTDDNLENALSPD